MVFRPKRTSTSAETDIDFGRNETAFRPKWQRQVCFYPPLNAILLGHRVVQGEKKLPQKSGDFCGSPHIKNNTEV